ncbi:MAG: aminotransferase class V-fold PLP-dependent enzyme [Bacteroidetes bacterium]|jgi:alanine-glyoxylate transaminase/serine-glyoxylate transaminase/serine-pyruvate transaminase|nr:aminotransferase class V-fold PLP-dependent enzyme [Bacteroidota bacterium]
MEYTPFTPPNRTLMGPGPSDVHPRVLEAMARPTIGHLDPAFVGLMDEIKALLQYAFQTENRLTMPVSGPGTAGMETGVVNLLEPGDTAIVCHNGVFGRRITAMAERAGAEVVVVEDPWGRAVDPEKVEAALKQHPEAKMLAFVHAETSTGVLSDAETLAALAHEYDCLTLVDTVTSFGGVPLHVDAWGLDVVYTGTQKCLSCVPGLSPITFGERAVEVVQQRTTPVQSWFLDTGLVMAYWGDGAQRSYHHTAPINALYALHEALLMLRKEGLEHAWARHRRLHEALKVGLEVLGLQFIVPEAERTPQLNAVSVPGGVNEGKVRHRLLREHDLEIGAGLGDLAGRIWRIGLMGYAARRENVLKCVDALGTVLADEGLAVDAQGALDAVQSALATPAEA